MYKKIILLITGIIFAFIMLNLICAQDIYYDGDYTNGEKIDFPDGQHIFVEGEIDQIEFEIDERWDIIELRNVSKAKIKTSFFKTEININREIETPLVGVSYFKGEEPSEIIFFIRETEKRLVSRVEINQQDMVISVNGGLKVYYKTALLLESNYFREGIYDIEVSNESEIIKLIMDELKFDELNQIRLKARLGKDSSIYLPLECPPVWLNKGGFFEINKNLFIFSPREFIAAGNGFHFFKFIPEEKVIFEAVENLDKFEGGCITNISSKESVSDNYIKNMDGRFFSFSTGDLKIIDGELEIDGSKIKGQNLYLLRNLERLEEFNGDEELKKDNSALFFDPELKTAVLSDNTNLDLNLNGQEIKIENGEFKEITPNFESIYKLGKKRTAEVETHIEEKLERRTDGTCEDFGGFWYDGNDCSKADTFWVGDSENIRTKAKITDYNPKRNLICCASIIKISIELRDIKTVGGEKTVHVSDNTLGRNILSTKEGTIIVDIAPQILKEDVEEIKNNVLTKEASLSLPQAIKITDLKEEVPDYLGVYLGETHGIRITRPHVGEVPGRSTAVHEALHHFYHTDYIYSQEKFNVAISKYMTDEKLDDKEKKTRDDLIVRLKDWEYSYKPSTEEEYFKRITSDEGHSVIGQWLYEKKLGQRQDIKFPEYVLELYEGILKPEIIVQGR